MTASQGLDCVRLASRPARRVRALPARFFHRTRLRSAAHESFHFCANFRFRPGCRLRRARGRRRDRAGEPRGLAHSHGTGTAAEEGLLQSKLSQRCVAGGGLRAAHQASLRPGSILRRPWQRLLGDGAGHDVGGDRIVRRRQQHRRDRCIRRRLLFAPAQFEILPLARLRRGSASEQLSGLDAVHLFARRRRRLDRVLAGPLGQRALSGGLDRAATQLPPEHAHDAGAGPDGRGSGARLPDRHGERRRHGYRHADDAGQHVRARRRRRGEPYGAGLGLRRVQHLRRRRQHRRNLQSRLQPHRAHRRDRRDDERAQLPGRRLYRRDQQFESGDALLSLWRGQARHRVRREQQSERHLDVRRRHQHWRHPSDEFQRFAL